MKYILCQIFCLMMSISLVNGQETGIEQQIKNILQENSADWQLTKEDISGFKISSYHTSQHSGVTHIYVEQTINDIPVYGILSNVNLRKNGKILTANNQFISDASSKISSTVASNSPEIAIQGFADFHQLQFNPKHFKSKLTNSAFTFEGIEFSDDDVKVQLVYYPIDENTLTLAWQVESSIKDHTDHWTSIIDATSNQHLHSFNHTTSCYFHKDIYTNQSHAHQDHKHYNTTKHPVDFQNTVEDGSSYLVYPVPLESPNQGDQELIEEPALDFASQFGWHGTDSLPGPEYTITRGNNAHAFDNSSGERTSQNDEPDGGESLDFQFVHDKLAEPDENILSDVTQLFYITNWIHDYSYFFGFDEAAGNFQENNFDNAGRGDDYVISRALELQFEDDVPRTNNAQFSTLNDGRNGIMFMFPWVDSDTDLLLTSPINRALPHGNPIVFGVPESSETISGEIARSFDSGGVSILDACDSITNASDLAGKIAFVDRGECDFSFKVHSLQEAGAIGVVVCNRDEDIINMGAGENSGLVDIYSAFIRRSDCDTILSILDSGLAVTMDLVYTTPIPAQLSSTFDNGVTVHEYTHGISTRLTGGRNMSSCLSSGEQMGEGWSDFLSLVATHKVGDKGEDARGLGNYLVDRFTQNSVGIRRSPYSTDMNINAQTYNDIRFTSYEPDGGRRNQHQVGEIWASAIWDMYWLFIDQFGFNPDWQNRESGNYKAVQLVFDGMKIQPCRPGLVDGRDAILAADQALFGGEHECLIWEAFRRRGIGFDAIQGSSFQTEDNFEGFEMAPVCQNQIVINKEATDIIAIGDPIEVTITVANNTNAEINGVTVTDVVPEGTVATSLAEFNPQYSEGDDMVTFDIGSMSPFESIQITYQLVTPSSIISVASFVDDFNATVFRPSSIFGDVAWTLESDINEGAIWNIQSPVEIFDQALVSEQAITLPGTKPVLQFRHSIDVELFFAGADVQISTDNGNNWTSIDKNKFLVNGYNDDVVFKEDNELGFTGDSDGFIESIIDLEEYAGQSIFVRFRFTSNVGGFFTEFASDQPGWFISKVQVYDLNSFNLNSACVNATGEATVCDGATTIIEADDTISTNDELKEEFNFSIFPNPSTGQVTINFDGQEIDRANIRVSSIDGALIYFNSVKPNRFKHIESIDLSHLSTGIYIVELISETVRISDKLIITAE